MNVAKCLKSHALVLLLTASGCGALAGSQPPETPHESAAPAQATQGSRVNPVNRVPDVMLKLARADLAERLGVDTGAIETGRLEIVQWRNGSAGCPKPGMMYTQMITPGYRIELTYAAQSYWYHGRGGREPFYCEHPEAPVSGPTDYATE